LSILEKNCGKIAEMAKTPPRQPGGEKTTLWIIFHSKRRKV
jgi:hypothetical protein